MNELTPENVERVYAQADASEVVASALQAVYGDNAKGAHEMLKKNAAALRALSAELEREREAAHYANGVAELAMKHRDIAEARLESVAREAIERAAAILDNHDSAPCRPAYPETWNAERENAYVSGQMDAALSWQHAIRRLNPSDIVAATGGEDG